MIRQKECPVCHGKRLNEAVLNCKINGYSIAELCELEFVQLREVLKEIKNERAIKA